METTSDAWFDESGLSTVAKAVLVTATPSKLASTLPSTCPIAWNVTV